MLAGLPFFPCGPQVEVVLTGSLVGQVPGALADLARLDLASLASVRKAAREIGSRYGQVDLLVSNAGLMMPPFATTEACAAAAAFGTSLAGTRPCPPSWSTSRPW